MRTSFHHQPEAQHPHSPAIYTPAGRLPHLLGHSRLIHSAPVTTNVRYASNSYRIIAAQRMTLIPKLGNLDSWCPTLCGDDRIVNASRIKCLDARDKPCLLYTSPSPRDRTRYR